MASVPLLAEKVVNADQLPEPMNLNGDWQFQFAADLNLSVLLGLSHLDPLIVSRRTFLVDILDE